MLTTWISYAHLVDIEVEAPSWEDAPRFKQAYIYRGQGSKMFDDVKIVGEERLRKHFKKLGLSWDDLVAEAERALYQAAIDRDEDLASAAADHAYDCWRDEQ